MKKIFSLLALCILTLSSSGQWRNVGAGGRVHDLTFLNDSIGYAVLSNGALGQCTGGHSLVKTIDGGINWIRLDTDVTTELDRVFFVNTMTGWIGTESANILYTTDGGMSWDQSSNTGLIGGAKDLWFLDENKGFGVGDDGRIRRTTNGGTSYGPVVSGTTEDLQRIYFYDQSLGFILGRNGVLLTTSNGGDSWSSESINADAISDVAFTSPSTGYINGTLNGSHFVWKTINGGSSWTPTEVEFQTQKISFPDENTGYLQGSLTGILKTTDAGATWTSQSTPSGFEQPGVGLTMDFLNPDYGFASAASGRIFRTTDGGANWLQVYSAGARGTCVSVTHRDTFYIGAENGVIYKSFNGGVSYKVVLELPQGPINELFFFDSYKGFACSNDGLIVKTEDGGASWAAMQTQGNFDISDITFVNEELGYASANQGIVYKTVDGGDSWSSLFFGESDVDFLDITFANADTGFVTSSGNGGSIYRTLDGGDSWTSFTPGPNGSFDDILFVNDVLGYAIKSSSRFTTVNAGEIWTEIDQQNISREELFMYNDSTGYIALGSSVAKTIDSLNTFSTMSTACNNTSVLDGVSCTDDGIYAVAVSSKILLLGPRELNRVQVAGDAYCPGSPISIAFYGRGLWTGLSTFTAQLSDASGSFDSPLDLQTYPATPFYYANGVIATTLPSGLADGQYRIRVVSTEPEIIGPDNGFDITIQQTIEPGVSISTNAGNTLCAGSPIQFTAQTTGGGLSPSVQWTLNGQPIGSDNSSLVLESPADGDLVEVTLISSLACANPASATASFNVSFDAVFETGLPSDTTICGGGEIALNANPEYTYEWSPATGLDNPNAPNPVATVDSDITYFVTVSDGGDCQSVDSVSIEVYPLPSIVLAADTAACANACIELNPAIDAEIQSVIWIPSEGLNDPNVLNPIWCADEDNSFTLTIIDLNNCEATATIAATVLPLPEAPVVSFDGITLLSTDAVAYQWYLNGELIPGATDQNLVPEQNGTYTVEIESIDGCSVFSEDFNLINLSTSQSDAAAIIIYPNPTDGIVTFSGLPANQQIHRLQVTNLAGAIVLETKKFDGQIDLSELPSGTYLIKFQMDQKELVKKVVKN